MVRRISPEKIAAFSHVRGTAKEAAEVRKFDANRRAQATNILNPADVKGDYDTERLLMTTLGGNVRPITKQDLEAFKVNAKTLGKSFRKGLTAQQVINLSLSIDRARANKQIHMATPAGLNKGVIRFVTNAAKGSNVTRHHVTVELVNYAAAVAMPSDPKKLSTLLVKDSPVKFDCDCGRHTFWFRYIATLGGYNAGRPETAYPKIRNPELTGIACKHVLRVMHELLSNMAIRGLVAKIVERGQSGELRQSSVVTQDKAKQIAKMQAARKRLISVKESAKSIKSLKKSAQNHVSQKKQVEQAQYDAERNLRKLKESGVLSKDDFAAIIKKLKGR